MALGIPEWRSRSTVTLAAVVIMRVETLEKGPLACLTAQRSRDPCPSGYHPRMPSSSLNSTFCRPPFQGPILRLNPVAGPPLGFHPRPLAAFLVSYRCGRVLEVDGCVSQELWSDGTILPGGVGLARVLLHRL